MLDNITTYSNKPTSTADNTGLLAGQTTIFTGSLQERKIVEYAWYFSTLSPGSAHHSDILVHVMQHTLHRRCVEVARTSVSHLTCLSMVHSVLKVVGRGGEYVEWVLVGSLASLTLLLSSSPSLAVLVGGSSSPCN